MTRSYSEQPLIVPANLPRNPNLLLILLLSWHAHTRQEVALRDLIAVLRRVRREVEGPIGGSHYDGDGYGNAASGGGGGGGDLGRSTGGARRTSLLRYIINPSEGEL